MDLLELAIATAREAGHMLVEDRPAGGPDIAATKSSPTDVVTKMDLAAEKLIIERIRADRPDDAFLGEEGGETAGTSGVRWVIDPIDGTVNYLYGLPDWAVSIAAEVDGETMVGAIAIPRRGELYAAVRGEGAYVARGDGSSEELHCNAGVPLEKALVATGFGYEAGRRAHQAQVLTGVLPVIRDIRRNGSCCVDLCSVASGRVDAYYERGTHAWDFAAGALIVSEAGGKVGGLGGNPPGPDMIVAGAPDVFQALHDLLVPLKP
jgi:myo-inositol-1(or 4)-monophosphatase